MTDPLDILTLAHQKAAAGQNVIVYAPRPSDCIKYSDTFSTFFGLERMDELTFRVRGNGLVHFRVEEQARTST